MPINPSTNRHSLDLIIQNRANYLTSVLEKKDAREVVYPERPTMKGQFDSVVDKTCLTPHDDTFFSKFTTVTYKRPAEVIGLPAVTALNKWIDNGFSLKGGKDDLGFLFFFEMMTGTLQIKLIQGDNPYQLGTLLLRYAYY